ncbi:Pre-mRNA-splicing factor 38B [Phytophthora cinnamomi]|uniref:Pre-mRNA-splicing factor 38B n=1 Tax=Phytophthora cinnamomi TaxID=4785 RepID=UPI00355984A8|nr:Pre-mRNA-splicing factor 38B [Phytophthora cinnamomi]
MSRSALTRHALQKSLRGQSDRTSRPRRQNDASRDEAGRNILSPPTSTSSTNCTYHEVVDEIYYRVDHAEPWSPGTARIPSSCFCLLHKFFLMRLTRKCRACSSHGSPYIRVVGFLYLRFTTIGEWLVSLLEENNYFGTILPRIPEKSRTGLKSSSCCCPGRKNVRKKTLRLLIA